MKRRILTFAMQWNEGFRRAFRVSFDRGSRKEKSSDKFLSTRVLLSASGVEGAVSGASETCLIRLLVSWLVTATWAIDGNRWTLYEAIERN